MAVYQLANVIRHTSPTAFQRPRFIDHTTSTTNHTATAHQRKVQSRLELDNSVMVKQPRACV